MVREGGGAGTAKAQYNLGIMYEDGHGVDVNYKKAFDGTRRRQSRETQRLSVIWVTFTIMAMAWM